MLQTEQLVSGYGELKVIAGISLEVPHGALVSLVGPNGAGKTTLLKTLAGLLPVMQGRIMFDGEDITNVPYHKRVRRGLALVPEGRELFGQMTVLENLEVACLAVGQHGQLGAMLAATYELFPRLRERKRQLAGTLSGGEQQMLAIGRALMTQPKLLMLDEPSGGLAPAVFHLVVERIGEIRRQGTTVLLVEQDTRTALDLCDRAYVLERGALVAEGTAQEVQDSDALGEAYLGLGSLRGERP